MSKRVEFRWPDELVAAIDAARGSEPRSAFVRRHIEPRVAVQEKKRYVVPVETSGGTPVEDGPPEILVDDLN